MIYVMYDLAEGEIILRRQAIYSKDEKSETKKKQNEDAISSFLIRLHGSNYIPATL